MKTIRKVLGRFTGSAPPRLQGGEELILSAPGFRVMQFSPAAGMLFLTSRRLVFQPNILAQPVFALKGTIELDLDTISDVDRQNLNRLRSLYFVPALKVHLRDGSYRRFQVAQADVWLERIKLELRKTSGSRERT